MSHSEPQQEEPGQEAEPCKLTECDAVIILDATPPLEEQAPGGPKRKREAPPDTPSPTEEADRLFEAALWAASGKSPEAKKRRVQSEERGASPKAAAEEANEKPPRAMPQRQQLFQWKQPSVRHQAQSQAQSQAQTQAQTQARTQVRTQVRTQARRNRQKVPIPLYAMCESALDETCAEDMAELKKLNYILGWINFRLVEKEFEKRWAGLYLWSAGKSLGKTLLWRTLAKVFKLYRWIFGDKSWQQGYADGARYDCIVYNALNGPLLDFDQVEDHGDRVPIVVPKRGQKYPNTIAPDTPFIITSNVPPEHLGYALADKDIGVWKERMLVICLDELNLFALIDTLCAHFGLEKEVTGKVPAMFPLNEL